jgi:hypothetical protein
VVIFGLDIIMVYRPMVKKQETQILSSVVTI